LTWASGGREVIDFAENDGVGAAFLAILDSDLW
jgi:hypothetical protein